MRIQTELEDVVLMKLVGLIARNIKDAKSKYGLKRQSDHLLLWPSLSIHLRLLGLWGYDYVLIQENIQTQSPTACSMGQRDRRGQRTRSVRDEADTQNHDCF